MKSWTDKKDLEERLDKVVDDMLKHRMVHLKDGPAMYVSGLSTDANYSHGNFCHMGMLQRENNCFYHKKRNMTFFCITGFNHNYRIIGAFDGDCILSDYVGEK